jgi:predicted ATPase
MAVVDRASCPALCRQQVRTALNNEHDATRSAKQDEATDLFALAYGWFTGGFNTLDLKEAEGRFDELSA